MEVRTAHLRFIILTLTLGLSACGSGDSSTGTESPVADINGSDSDSTQNGGSPDGDSTALDSDSDTFDSDILNAGDNTIRYGHLIAEQNFIHGISQSRKSDITGVFYEFESTGTQSDLLNYLMEPFSEGCVVYKASESTIPEAVLPTASSPQVSAGEAIPISGPAGSFTTLLREVTGAQLDYHPEAPLTSSLPAGLVASIPGDVFPSYPSVAIPLVPELRITNPTPDQVFTPSTPVSWDRNGNSNTYIAVGALFTVPETGESVTVVCSAIDDGEFSLPAATVAELALTESHATMTFSISRWAARVETNGASALYISNIYGDSYLYSIIRNQ